MCAVEHGYVGEVTAFVNQALDPLDNELSLSAGIHDGDEVGALAFGFYWAELLGEAKARRLRGKYGIGEIKDLGRAAIVGLDLVNLSAGVTLFKLHNVVEVCAAPSVDALRVVADCHDLVMPSELIDDVGL